MISRPQGQRVSFGASRRAVPPIASRLGVAIIVVVIRIECRSFWSLELRLKLDKTCRVDAIWKKEKQFERVRERLRWRELRNFGAHGKTIESKKQGMPKRQMCMFFWHIQMGGVEQGEREQRAYFREMPDSDGTGGTTVGPIEASASDRSFFLRDRKSEASLPTAREMLFPLKKSSS